MKKATEIFRSGNHVWQAIHRDPEKPDFLIDTNEYLVTHGEETLLTDPGGMEIFPAVFSALCKVVDPRTLSGIFALHQDPDIISSLSLWLEVKPTLPVHTSWLWTSFIPHFGGDAGTFRPIPDEGCELSVGGASLRAVPAHFLHSSGNFHLYDPLAKVLFSGDVGAALLPADAPLMVKDFDQHIQHARGFHQRWMGSAAARDAWCERVSRLSIDLLCPQHGAIYAGADVGRFISWFAELEVGVTRESAPAPVAAVA